MKIVTLPVLVIPARYVEVYYLSVSIAPVLGMNEALGYIEVVFVTMLICVYPFGVDNNVFVLSHDLVVCTVASILRLSGQYVVFSTNGQDRILLLLMIRLCCTYYLSFNRQAQVRIKFLRFLYLDR